jgi:ubiquinone/menaquinone biosynthesis C-methylase UbiE
LKEPEYHPFPNQRHRNFLQRVIEVPLFVRALRLPTGGRVLEVGCGRGVALPILDSLLRPSLLVGVDIEAAFLAEAARTLAPRSRIRLAQADVRQLPFLNAAFDVVIDFGTCYHVDAGQKALGEIARVLAPGGVFAAESKLAQLLAHPVRTRGRRLHVPRNSALERRQHAGLWLSFRKGT